jgi:hypothetical protein
VWEAYEIPYFNFRKEQSFSPKKLDHEYQKVHDVRRKWKAKSAPIIKKKKKK